MYIIGLSIKPMNGILFFSVVMRVFSEMPVNYFSRYKRDLDVAQVFLYGAMVSIRRSGG